MDCFNSILLVRSVGGGTGSGLGSRILEAVRETHPTVVLADAVIAPFAAGDTPTQHYNTILSLAWSQRFADATLHFSNDDLLLRAAAARRANLSVAAGAAPSSVAEARARGLLGGGGGGSGASEFTAGLFTRDLNNIIAEALAAIALPVRTHQSGKREGAGGARAGSSHRLLSRRAQEGRSSSGSAGDAAAAAVAAARPVWQDVRDPTTLGDPHANAFKFSGEEASSSSTVGSAEGGGCLSSGGEEGEEGSEYGERGSWIAASLAFRPAPTAEGGTPAAAAANLAGILAPTSSSSSSSSSSIATLPLDLVSLLNAVAPSPSHKFLDVRSVRPLAVGPGSAGAPSSSFLSLSEALIEVLPRYDAASRNVTTRAACLLLRGCTLEDCRGGAAAVAAAAAAAASAAPKKHTSQQHGRPPPALMAAVPPMWPGLPSGGDWERLSLQVTRGHTWATGSDPSQCRSSLLSLGGGEKSLTCVGNSDAFVAPLVRTIGRADALLGVGAYTHWYARHGVEREDILGAMHDLLDVVEAYRPPKQQAGQKRG
jgi:hypothetical protein